MRLSHSFELGNSTLLPPGTHVFTPTDLAPWLWYDSDFVTVATGVSALVDQMGHANAVQANAAKQPAQSGVLNGHTGVTGDGVDDFLQTAAIDSTTWPGMSVFMVYRDTATTLKALVDKSVNATAAGIYMNVNDGATGNTDLYLKGSTSAIKARRAASVPFSAATIWCAVFDPSLADGLEIKAYISGAPKTLADFIPGETTGNLGNAALTLLGLTNGTACCPGTIWNALLLPYAANADQVNSYTTWAKARYAL